MNKGLIIIGGLGAYFFLNKKSAPVTITKDKKEIKIGEVIIKKEYPMLIGNRKIIIDEELSKMPLSFVLSFDIPALMESMSYLIWSNQGKEGIYQDWISIMLYIQIAISEERWDRNDGYLPLILECGKKLTPELDTNTFVLINFKETKDQCDIRLFEARKLLSDISNYVRDTLPSCPPGAKCE